MFCSWTAIHHDVSQAWVTRNARRAAELGFGTWLTDDGWFTSKASFADYRYTERSIYELVRWYKITDVIILADTVTANHEMHQHRLKEVIRGHQAAWTVGRGQRYPMKPGRTWIILADFPRLVKVL